jgi:ABC-type phosphate/phosphonate transport system substrate-binding protein
VRQLLEGQRPRQDPSRLRPFQNRVQTSQLFLTSKSLEITAGLQASNKDECMSLLDQGEATVTTLDAGQIFIGGRYNSLVPIAQEVLPDNMLDYYAVAVVKKETLPDVRSLFDLRGTRACFAGVETIAGWVVPIYTVGPPLQQPHKI